MSRVLRCSFCGKSEHQVAKLVAGPRVYICDACIHAAKAIIDAHDDAPPEAAPDDPPPA